MGAARAPRWGWRDENRSLRRQSAVIAAVCLVGDTLPFAMRIADGSVPAGLWLAVVTVAVVDACLALPARTSGVVVVAQGAVRLAVALLLAWSGVDAALDLGNYAGLVVAGYRAGAWVRGAPAWFGLAALVLGLSAANLVERADGDPWLSIGVLYNAVLPWLIGRYTTGRAGYIDEVRQQAQEQRRAAAETVSRAAARDREAIARDLHDTISHHVSAVGVHAAAARLGLQAAVPPDTVVASLGKVELSSQYAMADLRRMLDLLHGRDRDGARQPGMANLPELIDHVQAAGLAVALDTARLEPTGLPASLDVAAYRVTQELLTNALRHGTGTAVELVIRHGDVALVIETRNPLPVPTRRSTGTHQGLDGIRHRASLFDGVVRAEATPDGRGWWTTVTFPLQTPRSENLR